MKKSDPPNPNAVGLVQEVNSDRALEMVEELLLKAKRSKAIDDALAQCLAEGRDSMLAKPATPTLVSNELVVILR